MEDFSNQKKIWQWSLKLFSKLEGIITNPELLEWTFLYVGYFKFKETLVSTLYRNLFMGHIELC